MRLRADNLGWQSYCIKPVLLKFLIDCIIRNDQGFGIFSNEYYGWEFFI